MMEQPERFCEMTGPMDTPPTDGEERAAMDSDLHDLKVLAISTIDRIRVLESLVLRLVAESAPKS